MLFQSSPVRGDLTNLVNEYALKAENFVADSVFPSAPVSLQSATVSVATRESMLSPVSLDKTKDGFTVADTKLGKLTYSCLPKGTSEVIDAQIQAPPGWIEERDTVNTLMARVHLAKEIEIATTLQNTAVWDDTIAPYYDGSVWATAATATPVADIQTAVMESENLTGVAPDTLVINSQQLAWLLGAAEVRSSFPGSAALTVPTLLANLAPIFGLTKLFVSRAKQNSSKVEDTFTAAAVWSNTYAMVCKTASPGAPLTEPSIGRTLEWDGDAPGWTVTVDYIGANKKQWIYTVSRNYEQKLIDPAFGCLLKVT